MVQLMLLRCTCLSSVAARQLNCAESELEPVECGSADLNFSYHFINPEEMRGVYHLLVSRYHNATAGVYLIRILEHHFK